MKKSYSNVLIKIIWQMKISRGIFIFFLFFFFDAKELETSKVLIDKLEKKTSPRMLSKQQKAILTNLVSFKSSFQVAGMCHMMDSECYNYAEQFASVFREAKWKVGETSHTFLGNIESDEVVAITENEQIEVANKIIFCS